MKICVFLCLSLFVSQAFAQQRLRDSLYGGRLKADTGKTFVSADTSKYVIMQNQAVSSQAGERQGGTASNAVVPLKPDESMPDSLNKLFYAKQKQWKRFIEMQTQILTQQADETKKVKKGTYTIDVEYEIGINGRVTTREIICNPTNEFLILQVTEIMKRPPVLAPPIYSDGKPRPMVGKQPITIVKK